jgi:hypothetical protein
LKICIRLALVIKDLLFLARPVPARYGPAWAKGQPVRSGSRIDTKTAKLIEFAAGKFASCLTFPAAKRFKKICYANFSKKALRYFAALR